MVPKILTTTTQTDTQAEMYTHLLNGLNCEALATKAFSPTDVNTHNNAINYRFCYNSQNAFRLHLIFSIFESNEIM